MPGHVPQVLSGSSNPGEDGELSRHTDHGEASESLVVPLQSGIGIFCSSRTITYSKGQPSPP